MNVRWVSLFAIALASCGGSGSTAPPPASSSAAVAQTPPPSSTEDPEPTGAADEGCSTGAPDRTSGVVLGVSWRYEEEGTTRRLVIGDRVYPLDREPTSGCFMSYALYGYWGRPSRMAWDLIHFDPDLSPLSHPIASTSDQEACHALDGALDVRMAAARRILDAHTILVEGGSEQQMQAAADWCVRTVGVRPSWMPATDPTAALVADVRLVIGGSFAVDHLGPARFDEVRAHVLAHPTASIEALDVVLASASPDVLASYHPSALYELTHPVAADRTLRSARTTIALYEAQMARDHVAQVTPPEVATRLGALDQRNRTVHLLIAGW